MRQMSEPGGASMADDPYAFPPGTPGMEGGPPHPGIRMSVANAFSVPPGTPQPPRMPERQMSMPGKCSFCSNHIDDNFSCTVKPVLSSHSKINRTKIL